MGIRPPELSSTFSELGKRGQKMIARVYLFWLLGLLALALNLHVTKFSTLGIEGSIEHSELIAGFFFLACILLYIGQFGVSIASLHFYTLLTPSVLERRAAIYKIAGKSHTLRRKKWEIRKLKDKARIQIGVNRVYGFCAVFLP